jgi:hypothetical protein
MTEIVGPGAVASCKNLYFTLTNTYRDEDVNIAGTDASNQTTSQVTSGGGGDIPGITNVGGNFVIDICGTIYKVSEPQPDSASITVIGGRDNFTHEKQSRPSVFYITQRQKMIIYKILFELASKTNKAELHSDNSVLEQIITSTYSNYCG